MVMRIYTPKVKTIVTFALILCLTMPYFFSGVAVSIMATHTHVCHNVEHKDVCVNERDCCNLCQNFYDVKNSIQTIYGDTTSKLPSTLVPYPVQSTSRFVFNYAISTTLVSLKVRLNN